MVDDILRMRATIATDESLAAIRNLGREIGLMPQKVKAPINDLNKTFASLGKTVQDTGRQITAVIPALSGFGVGAASVAVAAGALIKTFGDVADRVVELREASKELGMSEREIRAWSIAAQKVGLSSQSMMQGLKGFHEAMGALQYNQGSAFALYEKGAGPLATKLKSLKDPAEQLREIFKFKDTLLTMPNGQHRAEQFMIDMGLGADKVRLSADEAVKAFERLTPRTKEQEEAARKYRDGLIDLGTQWDNLVIKTGQPIFKGLTAAVKELNALIDRLDQLDKDLGEDPIGKAVQNFREGKLTTAEQKAKKEATEKGLLTPQGAPPSLSAIWEMLKKTPAQLLGNSDGNGKPLKFADMPAGTGKYDNFINALPFPDAEGQVEDRRGEGGGDPSGRQRIIKAGVFEALVDFQSYVQAGSGSAGGGGRAAFFSGGGGGGGAGGGSMGGGSGGLGAGSGGGGGIDIPGGGGGDAGPTGGGGSAGDRDGRPSTGAGGGGGAGPALGAPTAPKNERGAAIYQKLLAAFQKNPPKGLPPDAARFGITKGTPEEWARFGTSVAHAESGFDPSVKNLKDRGGSFGVFQYAHGQAGGNAYDVDKSVDAFVRDASASSVDPKGLRGGILGRRFSTIGKHPGRGAAYLSQASKFDGSTATPSEAATGGTAAPGSMLAATGLPPAAFIMHHTSGRGTIAGLKATLAQRHLGVEYGMDREGNIVQIGGPGSSHMKTGWGKGAGLSNRNTVGMEVIAKNDKDVTDAQRAAALKFIQERYPNTPVFGHGEVNPGHKEADEGMSITGDIRRARANQSVSTRLTDQAVASRGINANGQVSIQIHSDGTAARTKTRTAGDLFQKTQVQSYKQMQPTNAPAGRVNGDASTLPAQVGN